MIFVEGRSVRKYKDEDAVAEAAKAAGYKDIYRHTLITLTEMQKLMGKTKFEEVLGVPVAIYSNPDNKMPGWTYLSINNPNFEWVFEYIDDTRRNFRLYNVGTQNYLSGTTGADNVMNATGGLYTLVARGEQKFNILNTDEGAQNDGSLAGTWIIHANGHQYGSSPFGSICFWGNESTLSEWYIVESGSLRNNLSRYTLKAALCLYPSPPAGF